MEHEPKRHSMSNSRLYNRVFDNPGPRGPVEAAIVASYRRAVRDASLETSFPQNGFLPVCPWKFEQMMAGNFWPGVIP